jgi:hypothetical protein
VCQPSYRVFSHHKQGITVAVPGLMTEQFLTKRNLISHDVITDTSQLIAERFRCKTCICLSNFPVIVFSETFVMSTTQLGRFGKCPALIPITVFTVAIPFTFTIGQSPGRYTATIGCEITHFGKAVDIANLQHNRHCQDVADSGNRQLILKRLIVFYFFYNRFL